MTYRGQNKKFFVSIIVPQCVLHKAYLTWCFFQIEMFPDNHYLCTCQNCSGELKLKHKNRNRNSSFAMNIAKIHLQFTMQNESIQYIEYHTILRKYSYIAKDFYNQLW